MIFQSSGERFLIPNLTEKRAEALYEQYAAVVGATARSLRSRVPRAADVEDLHQVGRLALWAACLHFDPAREATFPAYVKMRVRGAMIDALRGAEFRAAFREREPLDAESQITSGICDVSKVPDPFVAAAVEQLGGRAAAVTGLRFALGMSRVEASRALGISAFAVARAERAAIKALRGLLRAA